MLSDAINAVPAGRWAVGVSGGADSVALLLLLRERARAAGDISPHVVHLNHQLRGQASDGDAEFVGDLSRELNLPYTIARRADVEAELSAEVKLPANASARYRAARMAAFKRATTDLSLQGVLLAHHADDQAETVLQRLLRGGSATGLAGMRSPSHVDGLLICRPLLTVPGAVLRSYLTDQGQAWREDASNASDDYGRNRLRRAMAGRDALRRALCEVATAANAWKQWADQCAPVLGEQIQIEALRRAPAVLAERAVRRWLVNRGVPAAQLGGAVVGRLMEMVQDSASPRQRQFPGGVVVRRRRGVLFAEPMDQGVPREG